MLKTKGQALAIERGQWRAVIDTHGAHVLSLSSGSDEILFYDEDDIGHSGIPLCLPFFGKLSAPLVYGGKNYGMPRHGFFRDRLFAPISVSDYSVTLALSSDDYSRESFPFDFDARVCVSLTETGLELELSMSNKSTEPLPLAPGLHPYFRVDDPETLLLASPGSMVVDSLADHRVIGIADCGYLIKTGKEEAGIPLYAVTGAPDLNIIDHHLPWTVLLDGERRIFMSYETFVFDRLTVWRKSPNSNSLCIEPSSHEDKITRGPILVPVGGTLSTVMRIGIR